MKDGEFEEIAGRLLKHANDYSDDELWAPARKARHYVEGTVDQSPMFPIFDRAGKVSGFQGSQAVVTECRDVEESLVPEILRVFTSSGTVVEFEPNGSEDVQNAAQATDLFNDIVWRQNDGMQMLDQCIRTWLRKFAALRVYVDEKHNDERITFTGLTGPEIAVLEADPSIVKVRATPRSVQVEYQVLPAPIVPGGPQAMVDQLMGGASPSAMNTALGTPGTMPDQPAPPNMPPVPPAVEGTALQQASIGGGGASEGGAQFAPPSNVLSPQVAMFAVEEEVFDGWYQRRDTTRSIKIRLLREDEFLIDAGASCIEDATVHGMVTWMRATDLVELGIDPDEVDKYAAMGISDIADRQFLRQNESGDSSLNWVKVVDAKIRADRDNDGIAECYRVIALGDGYDIVEWKEDPESDYYIVGSPIQKMRHPVGYGVVEHLYDLQEQQTALQRRLLDNAALSARPRPITNAGEKGITDLLNIFSGNPIRLTGSEQVNWFQTPFIGDQLMTVKEWLDDRRVMRTGISQASQGLDPNALKGQTVEAANAIVNGPQSRVEYYARRFADSVMRPLATAVLKLSVRFQNKPQTVRLRGEWIDVDPRSWSATFDAVVNVGLGTGNSAERLAAYNIVIQQQDVLLANGSEMVTVAHKRNVIEDLLKEMKLKDVNRYFAPMTEDEARAIRAQKQQGQGDSQTQSLQLQGQIQAQVGVAIENAKSQGAAEVARVKAESDAQIAQLKHQLDQQNAANDLAKARIQGEIDIEKERMRLAMQERLKIAEIQADRQLQLEKYQLDAKRDFAGHAANVVKGVDFGQKRAAAPSSGVDLD